MPYIFVKLNNVLLQYNSFIPIIYFKGNHNSLKYIEDKNSVIVLLAYT